MITREMHIKQLSDKYERDRKHQKLAMVKRK